MDGMNDDFFRKRGSLAAPWGGHIPPQAVEAEQAVLGAVLLEKDALERVDFVRPDMFYKEGHRIVFESVLKMKAENIPIDLISLKNHMNDAGVLESAGGIYYLTELTSRVSTSANIEHHAHIIEKKWKAREAIKVMVDAVAQLYLYADPEDTISVAATAIDNISTEGATAVIDVSQDIYGTLDEIELISKKKAEADERGEAFAAGIPTGLRLFDHRTAGWLPSDFIIIAGRPAMGKTAFMLTCARNASVDFQHPIAIFSLEMAYRQLEMRMLSIDSGVSVADMRRGNIGPADWPYLEAAGSALSKAKIYIDDTPALDISQLKIRARKLVRQYGVEAIFIDYIQLMRDRTNKGNREQEISSISRGCKEIAKELNIPVISLAQLSRAVETRGGDKKPMLSDLRESGSLEQDADMVVFLYRPEYYDLEVYEDGSSTKGVAELIVKKQRNGPVGTTRVGFIEKTTKFTDLNQYEEKEKIKVDPF